jgi:flagellar hook-length control protein FliK
MNIPQLTVATPPAASRGDEGRPVTEAAGTKADASGAPGSFAEVLKSKAAPKSAPASEETAEDTQPQVAREDTPILALMSGIPLPSENPLTPQLLVQLKSDVPAALQAAAPVAIPVAMLVALPAVAAAAEALATSAEAEEQQQAALALAGDLPTQAPLLAAAAIPAALAASPMNRPAPSGPLTTAGAVPSAPTLAPAKGQERGLTTPAPSVGRPMAPMQEVGGEAPGKQALFAASAAISAEASDMALPDASAEFRPLLDRLTDHAGNISAQTTPSQAPSQQTNAAPLQIRVTTPFAQAGWPQEVDQKLSWMVTNTRQQADLVLNPPDLGRIEVTLVVKGDEVSASFASPHQAVREAIEESLVRLRESLAESGINLGQTHVGRDSSRDAPFMKQEGEARPGNGSRREAGVAFGVPLSAATAWQPTRSRGMVDVFA